MQTVLASGKMRGWRQAWFLRLWIGFSSFSLVLVSTPLGAASRQPVSGDKGLVASTSSEASDIGAAILKQGGTAADAAVAVGLALAVTWPAAGNLGGGGFALVRPIKDEPQFVDFRETAPAAAHEKFYQDAAGNLLPEASLIGYRAVGIPGTLAGLEALHKRWGKLAWTKVVEPARRLASEGFRLEDSHVRMLRSSEELLRRFPETSRIFLPQGKIPEVGDLFVQKDLARSLAIVQKEGARGFYEGSLAKILLQDIKNNGGVITAADLKGYKVELRSPLEGKFKDFQILTAPPPSSGGILLLQMLGMLERDDLKSLGSGSAATLHLLVEAMRRAFADRSEWLGDPAFVKNPIRQLLDPSYLKQRRLSINLKEASASRDIKAADLKDADSEKPETTHFTVSDKDGMIVSITYTLNGNFGSGVTAKGSGILLNNEMDDFAAKVGEPNMFGLIQSARNRIEAGKRPLSSMTPTIFLKDEQAVLALGSPGGPTIINTVLQVSLNVLVHGMNVQEAVDAPRVHQQWLPDEIVYEPGGLNPDTRQKLESMGHRLTQKPRFMGDAQAIYFDLQSRSWSGGSDSRWGGKVTAVR